MWPKSSFLLFWILFSPVLLAAELAPFDAEYKVFRGNSYIADSQMSLKKKQGEWVWRMDTEARGLYKWLTRKKPFIETRLQPIDGELKLLLENSGDYPDKPATHSSWFDYRDQRIYSMKGTKIKKMKLPKNIYNLHSIHLLYPQMLEQQQNEKTVNFFKSGNVNKSTLNLQTGVRLKSDKKFGKEDIRVDKMTQKFAGEKKYFIYYYQGDTLAPLKIEQVNPGKDSSVMWRQD